MKGFSVMILAIFGLLQSGCLAQDVTLSVNHDTLLVKDGTPEVELICEASTDSFRYYTTNVVRWVHIQKGTNTEKQLTMNFHTVEAAVGDKYELTTDTEAAPFKFKLKIKNVADEDTGDFECQLERQDKTIATRAKVSFQVAYPIDDLILKFPKQNKRIKSEPGKLFLENKPLELLEGDHEFVCETRGSNPASIIELKLDGKVIPDLPPVVSIQDSRTFRSSGAYKSSLSARIPVMADSNNKVFQCVAWVPGVDFPQIVASYQFLVTSLTPDVFCTNLTTIEGNSYAKIKCNATSLSPMTCESINWEVSRKGKPVQFYPAVNRTREYEFTCKQINEKSVEVFAVINKVEAYHFESVMALDISVGGSKHRERMVIIESAWGSGCSALGSLLWVVMIGLVAVWKLC